MLYRQTFAVIEKRGAASPATAGPPDVPRSLFSSRRPRFRRPGPRPSEPPGGPRSLSSNFPVTAALDTAVPLGGALSLSSRISVNPAFACLAPRAHHDFEISRWIVTARDGRTSEFSKPLRLEKKVANIARPRDQETT